MSVLSRVSSQRELVENLVVRDFKSRYKQSTLGFAWAVVQPLVTAMIFTLVGGVFMRSRTGTLPFTIFSYYGLLFWTLFAASVLGATESLVSNISLITKVYFPREAFPVAAVLSKVLDFGFGLLGLLPLLLIFRILPSPGILMIVPLLAIVLLLATGIGLLCACANLFYRDVRYIAQLVLNLWFYLVPIIYPLSRVPARFQGMYLLNPMAALIQAARAVSFPQVEESVPWNHVGLAAVEGVLLFVIGYIVFKRYEPRFAEFV